MRLLILDGMTIESRQALHQQLARALAFPDYYGGNLDALADCLGDIREQTCIELIHPRALEERLGRYALHLTAVLAQAARENAQLEFIVTDDAQRPEAPETI